MNDLLNLAFNFWVGLAILAIILAQAIYQVCAAEHGLRGRAFWQVQHHHGGRA